MCLNWCKYNDAFLNPNLHNLFLCTLVSQGGERGGGGGGG